ncbi:MAG: hypothetical protein R3F56_09605 [Planctomycetota bacterium]
MDIRPGLMTTSEGSDPSVRSAGTFAYVSADDGAHGRELWRTDGTAAGTRLVRDVRVGVGGSQASSSLGLVDPAGVLYFWATDGMTGLEPWRSDGTEAGTRLIADIVPGSGGSNGFVFDMVWVVGPLGGRALFLASDGVHGLELWRTDGTAMGTSLVVDIEPGAGSPGIRFLGTAGGELFFATRLGGGADEQLWCTDGTAAGTVRLRDFGPGWPFLGVSKGIELGGAFYFGAFEVATGCELWRSDGTAVGTVLVRDIAPGADSGLQSVSLEFGVLGGAVYFAAGDVSTGQELWRSDGTTLGTSLVAELAAGATGSLPHGFAPLGVHLLFAANDGMHGIELWRSDGTAAGTSLVADIGASSSAPSEITPLGTIALFRANGSGGPELWRSDGTTSGTWRVRDIAPGTTGSAPSGFAPLGPHLLFTADDGTHGRELWRSDGASATTGLVADVWPPEGASSSPGGFRPLDDRVMFAADDGVHGRELWISDGTAAGTSLVVDVEPGSSGSSPVGLGTYQGAWLSVAWNAAQGWVLYSSDGTATGTHALAPINPASAPTYSWFQGLGETHGRFLFGAEDAALGSELWVTDGTPAGSGLLADLTPGPAGSQPAQGVEFQGDVFFLVRPLGLALGWGDLWRSDGTAAGTTRVASLQPGLLSAELVVSAGALYFVGDGGQGVELWRSDGTQAGTTLVADIRPGTAGSEPRELRDVGGMLVFVADDGVHGRELWRSDGTAAGTLLLGDLRPGAAGSDPTNLTVALDRLFFSADEDAGGREPWVSDGTAAGTARLVDLRPGSASSTPTDITAVGSGRNVVFGADDGTSGREVWTSDGTSAGTRLVEGLPGDAGVDPEQFVRAGYTVLFVAETMAAGVELWAMKLAVTGANLAEVRGQGCAGGHGGVPAMVVLGLPTLGNLGFGLGLRAARPLAPAALHLSPNPTRLSLPPCTVYLAAPYAIAPTATDAGGAAQVSLPLPAEPGLLGLEFHAQWSVLDPLGGQLLALSEALRGLVGD